MQLAILRDPKHEAVRAVPTPNISAQVETNTSKTSSELAAMSARKLAMGVRITKDANVRP